MGTHYFRSKFAKPLHKIIIMVINYYYYSKAPTTGTLTYAQRNTNNDKRKLRWSTQQRSHLELMSSISCLKSFSLRERERERELVESPHTSFPNAYLRDLETVLIRQHSRARRFLASCPLWYMLSTVVLDKRSISTRSI